MGLLLIKMAANKAIKFHPTLHRTYRIQESKVIYQMKWIGQWQVAEHVMNSPLHGPRKFFTSKQKGVCPNSGEVKWAARGKWEQAWSWVTLVELWKPFFLSFYFFLLLRDTWDWLEEGNERAALLLLAFPPSLSLSLAFICFSSLSLSVGDVHLLYFLFRGCHVFLTSFFLYSNSLLTTYFFL